MVVHTGAGDTALTASQVFSHLGLRSTYFRLIQQTLSAPKRSTANQRFQLQGRIWPRPSGHVTLEAKVGTDGAWTPIQATVTLDSDGRFSLTRSPTADVSYRIVRRGVFSPVVSVRVHPALTLTTTGGAFNGHVVPLLQGAGVTLQWLSGGTWTDSQTVAVDAHGDYTFGTAVSSGSWRVHYGGDADHGSAISATVVVP
jgi:hypothetical protein